MQGVQAGCSTFPQQIKQTAPAVTWHLTPGELEEINVVMRGAIPIGGPTPEGM